MQPIVDGLQQEFGNTIEVVRLDFEDDVNSELMDSLRVRVHPTFVVFAVGGEPSQPIIGQVPAERLHMAIQETLGD